MNEKRILFETINQQNKMIDELNEKIKNKQGSDNTNSLKPILYSVFYHLVLGSNKLTEESIDEAHESFNNLMTILINVLKEDLPLEEIENKYKNEIQSGKELYKMFSDVLENIPEDTFVIMKSSDTNQFNINNLFK